jgi:RNA polymerase sigma-70 factor (ECF subfamily)
MDPHFPFAAGVTWRERSSLHFLLRSGCSKKMQPEIWAFCLTWRRTSQLIAAPDTTTQGSVSSDLECVMRVLDGDMGAFEVIVRRWQGPLVNMAWRYCRDRARAEELAQEAFIRAWRGLATWRREGSFSTWLFALAANVFRSELKRFPANTLPIEEIAEPSHAASQQDELERRSFNDGVRRAVLALPMRYREPIVLFYFHEMDVAAAARTMKMAEGTFKARLARGRELLRRRFPQLRETPAAAAATILKTGRET